MVEQRKCVQCERVLPFDSFLQSRMRKDGSRGRMRFCIDCWGERHSGRVNGRSITDADKQESLRWGKREHMRRERSRDWFVLSFGGKRSRLAHSLAVYWTHRDDGECVTACGLKPYDHARDPLDVTFGIDVAVPHCERCQQALEGRLAA